MTLCGDLYYTPLLHCPVMNVTAYDYCGMAETWLTIGILLMIAGLCIYGIRKLSKKELKPQECK